MRTSRIKALFSVIAIAGLLVPQSSSAVGNPVIVSPPGSTFGEYHPSVIEKGDDVLYVHLDPTGLHDVTASCVYTGGVPGPGCGISVGKDNEPHCFRRIMPQPPLGEPYDPSTATYVYVHKDATNKSPDNPSQTTTNINLAHKDASGEPVKAREFKTGYCPIFFTILLSASESYPIEGIQNVKPGQIYNYTCKIHGSMDGVIAVLPARP